MNRLWILAGVALVVVAGGAGFALLNGGVPVEAARASVGAIQELVDEQAKTKLPLVHLITMPITGRIEAITLIEGAAVKKGQVVARLVPRDVELARQEAKAAVERLEAAIKENDDVRVEKTSWQQTLKFVASMEATVAAARERVKAGQAKLEYALAHRDRIAKLRARGASTEDEEDRAKLLLAESEVDYQQDRLILAASEAMLAATSLMPTMVAQYINRKEEKTGEVLVKQKAEAQAVLDRVEVEAKRSEMTSPVDGVVLDRLESNERHLSAGTVLMRIGDLSQLEVEAEILSQDVVRVKPGASAEVYGPAIGPKPAPATVARVYPTGFTKTSSLGVEQQRVKVILRFDPAELARLRTEQNLGVDYHVRVRIFTAQQQNTLVVPRSALFRGPSGNWQVFAVRGGRAKLQDVQVGLMNDEQVEITAGVEKNEPVILAPESQLTDGTRVSATVRD